MDTLAEITIYQPFFSLPSQRISPDELWQKVDSLLTEWDQTFSPEGEQSEVLRCNMRSGDTVDISDDLHAILDTALYYSRLLDGLFDPTLAPLKDFWQISSTDSTAPDPADSMIVDSLARILSSVGYHGLTLLDDPKQLVFSHSELSIDIGGLAKGFALERLDSLLIASGYHNFIVSVGGDIVVSGEKGHGQPIRVGVREPRHVSRDGLLTIFPMRTGAVVTSGDYERFRVARSGMRVHHIFDARTGFSAGENHSLTIKGESAIVADILSTGLFALPADSILTYVRRFSGYEALVVDSTGKSHQSLLF